jgi:uncharacterized protein YndB with AHSA1/START domain
MATADAQIAAPPERVFAVLANAWTYADWVMGSDVIRDVDPHWPAVGSRFYHRVGVWPLKIRDHTEVLEVDPPHRLVIHARARPAGSAQVTMQLAAHDGGTHVTMTEVAGGDRLSRLAINPLTDPLVRARNIESLRRLKRIAETGVVKP